MRVSSANNSSTGAQVTLNADARKAMKKYAARKLRIAGKIPSIIYGKGTPVPISIDIVEFSHAFRHISENTLIDIRINKQVRHVIIKDYSIETLTNKITHLDFLEIEKGKLLKTHVLLTIIGSAVGARHGGVFEQPIHEIEIECMPKDLPEKIEIDVSNLEVGDSLRASDISISEHVRLLTSPDTVLVHIASIRAVQLAESTEPIEDVTAAEADESEAE